MSSLAGTCRRGWRLLRSLVGEDAYERYLEHHLLRHPDRVPLERAAFYCAELERRWSQVNRCC